jgi:signal transduction histidine kinase
MSNAIRHGKPSRIEIAVVPCDPDGIRIQVVDDGIGLPMNSPVGRDPNQLGLVGMRERVMAMAGSLSIRHGHDGRGLALAAWLPRENSLQSHNMDKTE